VFRNEFFSQVEDAHALEFGQKHFLWWFGTAVDDQKLDKLRYKQNAVDLQGSENCLFVVVVRDPYDWLSGFYGPPWYVHESLLPSSRVFVSSEWRLGDRFLKFDGIFSEIDNVNPWTERPFENVLDLRKHKMLNYFVLRSLVDHYLIVRYEDVRDHPEAFLQFVADNYGLIKNDEYVPVTTYKGTDRPYQPKNYFSINPKTLRFINREIDWDVEKIIGYQQRERVN